MNKLIIAAAVAVSMFTAGCGSNAVPQDQFAQQDDQCLQAQNPQECSQFRDAGGDVSKYLVGGLGGAAAGYMLAKMMTPSGPRYYMQRDPSYHGRFVPIGRYDNSYRYVTRPNYRPYSVRYRRPITSMPTTRVVTTTTRNGGLFGRKTTTTTTTRRSSGFTRPSYTRPSYSRPSYSTTTTTRSYSSSRSRRR
jgi:hypothetical protein